MYVYGVKYMYMFNAWFCVQGDRCANHLYSHLLMGIYVHAILITLHTRMQNIFSYIRCLLHPHKLIASVC